MKLCLLHNLLEGLDPKHIAEIKALTGAELVETAYTKDTLPPVWNIYHLAFWGDFNWIRRQAQDKYDHVVFITTSTLLKAAGITHLGMYDLAAKPGSPHACYVGLKDRLNKKARANGFSSNLVWIVCHEYAHAREKEHGGPDRVHEMERQGNLRTLLTEYRIADLSTRVSTLREVVARLLERLVTKLKQ